MQGLGLKGIWIGFVIGQMHQVLMYIYLIHKTNWRQASYKALKTMKREGRGGAEVSSFTFRSFRMANDMSSFNMSRSNLMDKSTNEMSMEDSDNEEENDHRQEV